MTKSNIVEIKIPSNLKVSFQNGIFSISNGVLSSSMKLNFRYIIEISELFIAVIPPKDDHVGKMYTKTVCAIVKKMFEGLGSGFKKELKIEGVGYKANIVELNGVSFIRFLLGYSHSIFYKIPKFISIVVNRNAIILTSHDFQILGNFSSILCSLKKYDVYKKKGVLDLSKPKFRRQKSAKKK